MNCTECGREAPIDDEARTRRFVSPKVRRIYLYSADQRLCESLGWQRHPGDAWLCPNCISRGVTAAMDNARKRHTTIPRRLALVRDDEPADVDAGPEASDDDQP